MKKIFIYFNVLNILGTKTDLESLFIIPLKEDETLRLDHAGNFYRLQIPHEQATLWCRCLFWTHLLFNRQSHSVAIHKLIYLFNKKCEEIDFLTQEEYEQVISQIECLKYLKNDWGYIECGQNCEREVEEKLVEIEKKVTRVFECSLEQIINEQKRVEENRFLLMLKEIQMSLILLAKESLFGRLKSRHLLTAYSRDIITLFAQHVDNLKIRLLLIQEVYNTIELATNNKQQLSNLNLYGYLNILKESLDKEVNNLEVEWKNLIDHLHLHFFYHPQKKELKKKFEENELVRFKAQLTENLRSSKFI